MKIMIDIDAEQYKFIKQNMTIDKIKDYPALLFDICEHIANGTPLPKASEQDTCDNAVSRQAVLDLCDSKDPEYKVVHFKEDVECLPPVNPQPSKDCVDRHSVELLTYRYLKEPTDNHVAFYEELLDLPPVTPQTK